MKNILTVAKSLLVGWALVFGARFCQAESDFCSLPTGRLIQATQEVVGCIKKHGRDETSRSLPAACEHLIDYIDWVDLRNFDCLKEIPDGIGRVRLLPGAPVLRSFRLDYSCQEDKKDFAVVFVQEVKVGDFKVASIGYGIID